MKKYVSIIIAVMLIVSSFGVCAENSDKTQIIIEENDDLYVKIKVTTTVSTDTLTIKVHGDKNVPEMDTFLDQIEVPDSTDENGVHTYSFEFYAIEGAKSGVYTITCSTDKNNPVEFRLRTNDDKKAFYDALNGVASVDVPNVLTEHKDVIPDGLSGYTRLGLTAEGIALRTGICDKIASETYVVSADLSNVDLIDEKFCELYAENIIMSNLLCESDAADWKTYAQEAVNEIGFDNKYLVNLDADVLYGNFVQLKGTTLDKAAIIEAYDRATMLSAVNSFNAQIAKEAIEYFGAKGTSGLVFTDYNSLNENDKIIVCGTVKSEKRETFAELKEVFEEKANELKINSGVPQGGTTGGGITGSGAAGGTIAGGGGSREETKEDKPQALTVSFSDISAYDWAKESILYLAEMGVLNGRGNNIFDPGTAVTKEEFVKIIIEALQFNIKDVSVDFSDVSKERWSYKYIASAYNIGIINGMSDTYFGASTNITRQDMAVILERVLKITGVENNSNKMEFSDYSEVSDYAKTAVDMLSGLKIINGMGDGTFAPKQEVTRAQAAKVVYEVMGLLK